MSKQELATCRVADVMTPEPKTVRPDEALLQAVEQMDQLGVRHLIVAEESRVVGMLSDRDLSRRFLFHKKYQPLELKATPVHAVMTSAPVWTTSPQATVVEATQLMREHQINALPVVDQGGALIGILTSDDLLQLLVKLGS